MSQGFPATPIVTPHLTEGTTWYLHLCYFQNPSWWLAKHSPEGHRRILQTPDGFGSPRDATNHTTYSAMFQRVARGNFPEMDVVPWSRTSIVSPHYRNGDQGAWLTKPYYGSDASPHHFLSLQSELRGRSRTCSGWRTSQCETLAPVIRYGHTQIEEQEWIKFDHNLHPSRVVSSVFRRPVQVDAACESPI